MVTRKPKPKLSSTAIDAIVVALSPALIIGMVSCLVFFLVVAFYRGQYDQRLIYILGLYTFAIVLIARIAIESGRAHSMVFSVGLGLATIVAMAKFVTISGVLAPVGWLVNITLLAVAWFLADRITFDCTLVDERERGVQQGLLQSLGLLKKEAAVGATQTDKSPQTKRKHNPGIWVLYFSLLAFPLFGVGQLLISDEAERNRAFFYLVGYLACGLALLVTTSFVNMRRYLRHRGVAMPGEMNRAWLGYGLFGVFVVLALCMLMPLPGRSLGVVGLPFDIKFESPDGLGGNRGGWGGEGGEESNNSEQVSTVTSDDASQQGDVAQADAKGEPLASDQAESDSPKAASAGEPDSGDPPDRASDSSKSESPDQSRSNAEQEANNSEGGKQDAAKNEQSPPSNEDQERASEEDRARENRKADPQESNEKSAQKKDKAEPNNKKNEPQANTAPKKTPERSSSSSPEWLKSLTSNFATLFKWITIVVLAGVVIFYAVTHPREIAKMWRDLMQMISGWFGRTASTELNSRAAIEPESSKNKKRSFSSYDNPFNTSGDWTPERIVEHTFAALEAWAAERGAARALDQTAVEFATQLSRRAPTLKNHASNAAKMFNELLFAGWTPQARDVAPLAELWRVMQNN